MRKAILIGLALAIPTAAAPAYGQFAAEQQSSLEGLRGIYVGFADMTGELDAATQQRLYSRATLELRKAGLRMLEATWEGQELQAEVGEHALLNIGIAAAGGGLANDHLRIRMDVEQKVIVRRTGKELRLVTWFYEDDRRPMRWAEDVDTALLEGINMFLNDWLAANGR